MENPVTKIYEKGTIKVVWIDKNPAKIYSKMFYNEQAAKDFAKKKKNYLILALISQVNMEKFSWEILPYGRYKVYKTFINRYNKYEGKKIFNLIKSVL